MTLAEAESSALDIAVKNDVSLFSSSRTEMGRVVVRLSDLADVTKPTSAWYVHMADTQGQTGSSNRPLAKETGPVSSGVTRNS